MKFKALIWIKEYLPFMMGIVTGALIFTIFIIIAIRALTVDSSLI